MLALVSTSFLAIGCKPSTPPATAITPAPAMAEGTPATEAECKQFAAALEKAARERNRAEFDKLLSLEELFVRCVSDIKMPSGQSQTLVSTARARAKDNTLAQQIWHELENKGSYHLLRVHSVDGRWRALFRLYGDDSGVNYHDIVVARLPNGQLGMEDIYVFAAGEMMTHLMRRIMLPLFAEMNRGILDELRGTDKLYVNNLGNLQAMTTAVKARDSAKATAKYKLLPVELREQKAILLMYITVLDPEDDNYAKALGDFRRLFPTDPAVDFHSIDYHLLKKDYAQSIECIDKTQKSIGGDAYLDVLRANVLLEAGRMPEAAASAEKAVAAEPDMTQAYWSRITIALKEKKHKDTRTWLQKLVEHTDEAIDDLTKVDAYADFVKSPEHGAWLKWYAAFKKKAGDEKE
jgi:tetratricopeptide (TPR) repeat protein